MPGRSRQGRKDNFKIYLTDTGPENMNLINLIQDGDKYWAGVNTNDASRSIKCWILLDKLKNY